MTPKRNPERVLRALAAYLRENPDMRVGQAVANHLPVAAGNDPFYVEDDDLATLLECSTPPSAPSPRDEGRARGPLMDALWALDNQFTMARLPTDDRDANIIAAAAAVVREYRALSPSLGTEGR
jgi:hypothetical protein